MFVSCVNYYDMQVYIEMNDHESSWAAEKTYFELRQFNYIQDCIACPVWLIELQIFNKVSEMCTECSLPEAARGSNEACVIS